MPGIRFIILMTMLLGATVLSAAWIATPSLHQDSSLTGCLSEETAKSREACVAQRSRDILKQDGVDKLAARLDAAAVDDEFLRMCHFAVHPIGMRIGMHDAHVGQDAPTFVKAKTVCSQGIVHGIVMGFHEHDTDKQLKEFNPATSCPRAEGKAPQISSCLHGFGHALMHATGDPKKSFRQCVNVGSSIEDKDARTGARIQCGAGVAMEYLERPENVEKGCTFDGAEYKSLRFACLGYLRMAAWVKGDGISNAQQRCDEQARTKQEKFTCQYDVAGLLRSAFMQF